MGYRLSSILVVLGMLAAMFIRFSFTNVGDQIYDYEFGGGITSSVMKESFAEFHITKPEDMVANADTILKVKYGGHRQVTELAFYSQVTVLEVYKGDKALNGKEINVMEDISTFVSNKYVNSVAALTVMQPENEYLLLLKKPQFDETRKLTEYQQNLFYIYPKYSLGCFPIMDQKQTKLYPIDDGTQTLNNRKEFEVYIVDQEGLDLYYQYKDTIFKLLSVNN